MYRTLLNNCWLLNEYGTETKLPINVPGDINDTLRKADITPDPYFDTNAIDCFWITSKMWDYTLRFNVEDNKDIPVRLVFKGIDGTAEIFLNGKSLGTAKNAFHPHIFDVSDILKSGENQLLVRFAAIDDLLGKREVVVEGLKEQWVDDGPRAFLRKPAYNFGWDWAISLPSLGLCGEVYLEYDYKCEIIDYSIRTFVDGRVDFDFEVSNDAVLSDYTLVLTVNGYGNNEKRIIKEKTHRAYTTIRINEPKIWWPIGYGEQPLYSYKLELIINECCVQTIDGRFGIREITTLEEPFTEEAGRGRSFWFIVNGKRIFAKGANFVPMELWPGIVKQEEYDYYLRMTAEANFNMQRVWGGGFYENDRFYDLCDELGILVWQDFMFASSGHPFDSLRDEIVLEATYQIRRLRNHPCIAIWCGCNEDVYSWAYGSQIGMESEIMSIKEGNAQNDIADFGKSDTVRKHRLKYDPLLYTALLRGIVGKLSPDTPYVESSPQSYDDFGNAPSSGNSHISCWKAALFDTNGDYSAWREHFNKVCSFDSEFCIQGPCSEKYTRSFLKQQNHWPPNDAWDFHIQRGHNDLTHFQQTMWIAGATIGEITDLSTYVRHGQATHIEMMRAEFDSARADYPNNGGTMVWMFNDCWPTSNWSIIDYSKMPKPSYYAAKRACAPIAPIIFERNGIIKMFVSNHTNFECSIEANWGGENFDGITVWSDTSTANVNATEAYTLCSLPKSELEASDYIFLDVKADGKPLSRVIYYPNGFKDIEYPEPKYKIEAITVNKVAEGTVCELTVKAESFLRLFHIIPIDENARPIISDNYFDLTKGEQRRICVTFTEEPETTELRFGEWYHNWE